MEIAKYRRATKNEHNDYVWIYPMNLLKETMLVFSIFKVLLLSALAPVILLIILSLAEGDFIKQIPIFLKLYALLAGISLMLLLIGYYLIYIPIHGNLYTIIYKMSSHKLQFIESNKNHQKTELLSLIGVLVGGVAGSPTTVGANLLAGSRKQMATDFKNVRKVIIYHKINRIKLISTDMTRMLVCYDNMDQNIIENAIITACKKGKICHK